MLERPGRTSATRSRRARCWPSSTRATSGSAEDAARAARGERRRQPASRPRPTSSATSDLRDQGFISGAELERRETTLKAAQAQLDAGAGAVGVQGNQAALRHAGRRRGGRDHRRRRRAGAWWSPPARRSCASPTTARATWCSRCPRTRSALMQACWRARRRVAGAALERGQRRCARRRCARSPPRADPATRTFWSRPTSVPRRRCGSARPRRSRSPRRGVAGVAQAAAVGAAQEDQGSRGLGASTRPR